MRRLLLLAPHHLRAGVAELRFRVFANLMQLDVAWFDEHQTDKLVRPLSSDVTPAEAALCGEGAWVVRYAIMVIIGGLGFSITNSPNLTELVLPAVPPILGLASVLYRGRVVESSSSDTVIAKRGRYLRLIRPQLGSRWCATGGSTYEVQETLGH